MHLREFQSSPILRLPELLTGYNTRAKFAVVVAVVATVTERKYCSRTVVVAVVMVGAGLPQRQEETTKERSRYNKERQRRIGDEAADYTFVASSAFAVDASSITSTSLVRWSEMEDRGEQRQK